MRFHSKKLGIITGVFIGLQVLLPLSGPVFHMLFPSLDRPLYIRSSFIGLTIDHLGFVLGATGLATVLGMLASILVTRPIGSRLKPLLMVLGSIGQTFPPVAVLAVMVPIVGYGSEPTLVALFVYALLPIVLNTIVGLEGVDPRVLESADGMGFSPLRRLMQIELPLAAPVIISGIRTAAIINIGTATIGSTVGAATLGAPIIDGLTGSNTAFVIQGSLAVATLALLVDSSFEDVERRLLAT